MQVVVVSWTGVSARARSTARHAAAVGAAVTVLDLDGSYRPAGGEQVLRPADLGGSDAAVRRSVLAHGASGAAASLAPTVVRRVAEADEAVLIAAPGVLLLAPPAALLDGATRTGLAVVASDPGPVPADGRHPDAADLARTGVHLPTLVAVRADAPALGRWGDGSHWLDVAAAAQPHVVLRGPAALLAAGTLHASHRLTDAPLAVDGAAVVAVDLSTLDPDQPWLLDPDLPAPRALLSDHPVLAALVAQEVGRWAAEPAAEGDWNPDVAGVGLPLDDTLRAAAALAGPDAPDLLDPAEADAARRWLIGAVDGGPGPYLLALRSRPDLAATFPRVPGPDTAGFLAWARTHAVADGAAAELLVPALAAVVPPSAPARHPRPRPGVNVVGFLGSELGIGESARLLVSALGAARVPYSTTAVDRFAQSRPTAVGPLGGDPDAVYDTTVMCVNSDLTPTVAPAVAHLLERSYRVGMWYWEVEDFPASQHGGFAVLDEVWVATDFVRDAIAPHSPVPVRVLTPPLPQPGGEPALSRAQLGLPDRPYLLFSFDFLSTAERKNPVGLVEAFSRAFGPDQGPLLVIKSINADKRPAQAERLRLAAAGRPDVLLLEDHLPADARDSLVAHCLAYVSLHRAEGLGLTMAEAMAWGKPVVATGYSGNLQFMTDENSFLVPWTPAVVPAGAPPYPAGGTWADPDLEEAARLIRLVWDSPDEAAARGVCAARDLAALHTAEVAGTAFAARLTELSGARRARSRRSLAVSGRQAAERLGRRLLR